MNQQGANLILNGIWWTVLDVSVRTWLDMDTVWVEAFGYG